MLTKTIENMMCCGVNSVFVKIFQCAGCLTTINNRRFQLVFIKSFSRVAVPVPVYSINALITAHLVSVPVWSMGSSGHHTSGCYFVTSPLTEYLIIFGSIRRKYWVFIHLEWEHLRNYTPSQTLSSNLWLIWSLWF